MNTASDFPEKAADLLFFQDISLEQSGVREPFYRSLREQSYSQASRLLRESGASYYGAALFNLIENEIHSLQTYLKNHPKVNPYIYAGHKPDNLTNGAMWIG